MRVLRIFSLVALLAFSVLNQSCRRNDLLPGAQDGILPSEFKIDIPDAISFETFVGKGSGKTGGAAVDTLEGNHIYHHLRTFIHVGEGAGDMVENIMNAIRVHDINKPMSFSFRSDGDDRIKDVEIIADVTFEGVKWDYQLNIFDALSINEPDMGIALQLFWSVDPLKGIAIIKPFNMDRSGHGDAEDAVFRVDYNTAGGFGYDKYMIVAITGLPLEDPLDEPFSMYALKMFVGKSGDKIDVYGNSDHPNAKFLTAETGFDWAFAASSDRAKKIGVAEVGLPSNDLNSDDRTVILVDNSIKNVLSDQIYDV
ncbi:MAG: hypothetical protein IIA45_15525, partial [Bacteroidetes bacterium]|nr:hypothetical protein [Bacteroidota bacterium]